MALPKNNVLFKHDSFRLKRHLVDWRRNSNGHLADSLGSSGVFVFCVPEWWGRCLSRVNWYSRLPLDGAVSQICIMNAVFVRIL